MMRAPVLLLVLLVACAASASDSFNPPPAVFAPRRPAPAPDVAYWKFDGDSSDSAGSHNWGAFTAAVTYATGQEGQALDFGTGSCATQTGATAITNALAGDFTFTTWMRYGVSARQNNLFIYGEHTTGRMFLFVTDSVRRPVLGWKSASSDPWHVINYSFPVDSWVHVAIRRSGTTVDFMVNGALHTRLTSQPLPVVQASPSAYLSGWEGGCDDPFPGRLDDFRIYGSALSDAQVSALAAM